MRSRPLLLSTTALAALLALPSLAHAQMGGGGGRQQSAPTQSGPTQNRTVGPRAGQAAADDDDAPPTSVSQRAEPLTAPPADPLAVPPEIQARIGSDATLPPPVPVGDMHRSFFPIYEESRGDYRFRTLPPLWLEYTRGLRTSKPVYGEPSQEDRQSLTAFLFYQRRSPKFDADVLFPLAWHVRDDQAHAYVLGPIAHREAPGEHDNWLAPLVFEGERKDGGYFHMPLLLTSSHWSSEKAFTWSFNYFRDRRGTDVDWGLVPFAFHGDNGNLDGGRRKYTLIPPLAFFHKENELDGHELTVAGPLILEQTPKRSITDLAPFFFHIEGKPENGGAHESHTTLFPFFHYGHNEDEKLLVLPGLLHRSTASVDTLLTPLYSHATTRNGATSLTAVGPVIPLFWSYRDTDLNERSLAVAPFFYTWDSPRGHDWLTPLMGRFETYGVSTTYWAAPTIVVTTDTTGWEADLLPVAFIGRGKESSHTVLAPLFWDFANTKGRTTVALPAYFRIADSTDDSVTQIAGNTLFMQKRVAGGLDWQFHVLPFFSYGEVPQGHWWNVLMGLAGYSHDTDGSKTVRALWIPIPVGGPTAVKAAAAPAVVPSQEAGKF